MILIWFLAVDNFFGRKSRQQEVFIGVKNKDNFNAFSKIIQN